MSQLKMAAVKENSKFNPFLNISVTIDIQDLYNREVSKFSQKEFVIAVMLVEKLIAIKL